MKQPMSLLTLVVLCLTSVAQAAPVEVAFSVDIVSGSRAGQVIKGRLTFDPETMQDGVTTVDKISMKYGGKAFGIDGFDGPPKIRLLNSGYELEGTGGPQTLRFGFNAGFGRHQFGRDSERFVREGQPYFGYLRPDTIVDGVGRVTYVGMPAVKRVAAESARVDFVVTAASGSREAGQWMGFFDYDPHALKQHGRATVQALRFQYAGRLFELKDFDATPTVETVDGALRLIAVGGPQTARFGFNAGFERGQFGRASEAFVRQGAQYFGYLKPDTIVDGVGRITYEPRARCTP